MAEQESAGGSDTQDSGAEEPAEDRGHHDGGNETPAGAKGGSDVPDRAVAPHDGTDSEDQAPQDGPAGYEPSAGVREKVVDEGVRAKNFFAHNTFSGTVFINGDSGQVLELIDHSGSVESLSASYTRPRFLDELDLLLARNPTALIVGPASIGKRSAAIVALHKAGHSPVCELNAVHSFSMLHRSIATLIRQSPRVGVVMAEVPGDLLDEMSYFRAQSLAQAFTKGGASAALVFTAKEAPRLAVDYFPVVNADSPPVTEIMSALSQKLGVEDVYASRVAALADKLCITGFSEIESLLLLVLKNPTESDEELGDRFLKKGGRSLLEEWLKNKPSLSSYAALLTTAACEHMPYSNAMTLSDSLCEIYLKDQDAHDDIATTFYRSLDENELLMIAREDHFTHFGVQSEEVVTLIEPLSAVEVIEFLWSRANYRLQAAITEWLPVLARSANSDARLGAAMVAGTLFSIDARHVERTLLRPWAVSGHGPSVRAAGTALGMPTVLGRDGTGARLLASQWASSHNLSLRRSALAAYGGLLGAWDPASNASTTLWELGESDMRLRKDADVGLSQLTIGGSGAARSRLAVLTLLKSQLTFSAAHGRRVRSVFESVVIFLCSPISSANDSLKTVCRDEPGTRLLFCHLLSECLLNGGSDQTGLRVIDSLTSAVSNRRLERSDLVNLIRQTRDHVDSQGLRPKLRVVLQRALVSLSRRADDDRTVQVVESLLWQFFKMKGREEHGRQ